MRNQSCSYSRTNKLFDASALSLSLFRSRIGLFFLPAFFAMTFTQCTKNEIVTDSGHPTFVDQDRKALLNDIIGKTGEIRNASANLRSTNYTISEALDLLDESLNYAYCRPGTPLQNTLILSDTLVMEVDSSAYVTATEIADLFDEASLDIGTQYHNLGSLANLETWAFSVTQVGDLENNEVTVIVQLEAAYGGYITSAITYGGSDDFSYHYGGGTCGSTQVDGAPEILRDNLKLEYVYNPSGKKYFKRGYYLWVCNEVGTSTACDAYGIPNNIHREDERLLNNMLALPQYRNNINDWELFRQHEGVTVNFDRCLSGDVEMPHCEDEMGDIITGANPGIYYNPGNIYVGSFELTQGVYDVPFHNMLVVYYKTVTVETNDEKISLPCHDC